ncbi:MAG: hypothetical protein HOV81_28705 [Kofleriaceae bacterium]|nr:hypothetical protein [Kofleriaceae bacterium]
MRTIEQLCRDALHVISPLAATQLAPAALDVLRTKAPRLVKKAETLDFRTLTPVPGGLFDYKVFGPGTVIDAPALADDEPIGPRKTQFARLELTLPIVHPLLVDALPDEVAERAGWDRGRFARWRRAEEEPYTALVEALEAAGHDALVMRALAVLPPDLRPLARLDDDRWATSPLNELYRRVISTNERIAKLVEQNAPPPIIGVERMRLASAVLHLAMNERCAEPVRDGQGQALTSLIGSCGGSTGLDQGIAALDRRRADRTADAPTGRLYRVESVVLALGFELRDNA